MKIEFYKTRPGNLTAGDLKPGKFYVDQSDNDLFLVFEGARDQKMFLIVGEIPRNPDAIPAFVVRPVPFLYDFLAYPNTRFREVEVSLKVIDQATDS